MQRNPRDLEAYLASNPDALRRIIEDINSPYSVAPDDPVLMSLPVPDRYRELWQDTPESAVSERIVVQTVRPSDDELRTAHRVFVAAILVAIWIGLGAVCGLCATLAGCCWWLHKRLETRHSERF